MVVSSPVPAGSTYWWGTMVAPFTFVIQRIFSKLQLRYFGKGARQ